MKYYICWKIIFLSISNIIISLKIHWLPGWLCAIEVVYDWLNLILQIFHKSLHGDHGRRQGLKDGILYRFQVVVNYYSTTQYWAGPLFDSQKLVRTCVSSLIPGSHRALDRSCIQFRICIISGRSLPRCSSDRKMQFCFMRCCRLCIFD